MAENKLISIIVPVYNEEENIPLLYDELKQELAKLNYNHELIFVDDGSTDKTKEIINKLIDSDQNIKLIEFTRNFGKEAATTAGINMCNGDACIILDADLQHPIKYIPEFIKKWETGDEVVIGVKSKENERSFFRRACSSLFYWLMNSISSTPIIPHSTDFRLLDRIVIDEFNKLTERNRMTRGLVAWLGFKRSHITFIVGERHAGKVKYSYPKLFKLAMHTFVGHSLLPLKLAGYLGIFITFSSGSLGFFILIERYILNDPWNLGFSGPAILAIIILFLVGIILICLGLIALYVGNIHGEVRGRPLYVIRRKL